VELSHLTFRVGDLDRSVAFFASLGFREQFRFHADEQTTNVFLELAGMPTRLELAALDAPAESGYSHFAIRVDDLDATLAALAAQGIELEPGQGIIEAGSARYCYLRDPDGGRIELLESHT
jgi:lactoylglutathione lyase